MGPDYFGFVATQISVVDAAVVGEFETAAAAFNVAPNPEFPTALAGGQTRLKLAIVSQQRCGGGVLGPILGPKREVRAGVAVKVHVHARRDVQDRVVDHVLARRAFE